MFFPEHPRTCQPVPGRNRFIKKIEKNSYFFFESTENLFNFTHTLSGHADSFLGDLVIDLQSCSIF